MHKYSSANTEIKQQWSNIDINQKYQLLEMKKHCFTSVTTQLRLVKLLFSTTLQVRWVKQQHITGCMLPYPQWSVKKVFTTALMNAKASCSCSSQSYETLPSCGQRHTQTHWTLTVQNTLDSAVLMTYILFHNKVYIYIWWVNIGNKWISACKIQRTLR